MGSLQYSHSLYTYYINCHCLCFWWEMVLWVTRWTSIQKTASEIELLAPNHFKLWQHLTGESIKKISSLSFMLVVKFTTIPPPASFLRSCFWGLTGHNSTPLHNAMVRRNFLLGRDHLISICCDIFWKPISSIMGNGCRSRAIISVIYEQCKQMVFWIFGLFPKTSCKLSCCILLHGKPVLPGKGLGWLWIWLCTWKQGQRMLLA